MGPKWFVLLSMVISGHIWLSVVISGHIWLSVVITWLSIGSECLSLVIRR